MKKLCHDMAFRGSPARQGALGPLLRGGPLSKDAVSRLVGRLREDFETWRTRHLADQNIRYVFMDGWYPKVRIGGRRVRVPVLVTLAVRASGERVVLDLRLAGEETAASWREVVTSLVARHLARPVLAVIDGNPGLRTALQAEWPGIEIQRGTAHYADVGIRRTRCNILEYLNDRQRPWAPGDPAPCLPERRCEDHSAAALDLARRLETEYPSAAESVREGLDETLTVLTLNLSARLRRSLPPRTPDHIDSSRARSHGSALRECGLWR